MDTLGFGRIGPVSSAVPFTYRDGITFQTLLYAIRDHVIETLPANMKTMLDEVVDGVNGAMEGMHNRIISNEEEFNRTYTLFSESITESITNYTNTIQAEISAINNKTGVAEIQRVSITGDYVLSVDPTWPNNHPVHVVMTQGTTPHKISLASNISGQFRPNINPGGVTTVTLIPNGDGSWTLDQPDAFDPSDFSRAYHKRVAANLPIRHKDFTAMMQMWGQWYPQSFAIDEQADQIFLITAAPQVVQVYKWSTGEYLQCFGISASTALSEGAVIRYESGTRYLYLRSSPNRLSRYNISQLPKNLTAIGAESSTEDISANRNFSFYNNEWIVNSGQPSLGGAGMVNRGVMTRYDTNFKKLGDLFIDPALVGGSSGGDYELAGLPKIQGFASGPGYYVGGYGGQWYRDSETTPYHYQGIRVFSGNGNVLVDSLLHPNRMAEILGENGFTNVPQIENEGVQVVGGKIFSLTALYNSETSPAIIENGGVVIFEEFSNSPDAIDFSRAATTWTSPEAYKTQSGLQQRTPGPEGFGMYNPVTNTKFTTLQQVLEYMRNINQSRMMFYTSAISLTDFDGVPVTGGHIATVTNANNSTFFVELMGDMFASYKIVYDSASKVWTQSRYTPRAGWNYSPYADGNTAIGTSDRRWREIHLANSIFINSPDGVAWRVSVDNTGALKTAKVV